MENWLKTEPEDSDKYASAKWLLAQDSVFSLGSIEGSERAMQWREAYSRTTANEVGNKFAELVSKAKINGGVPDVLAKLDHWQLKKLGVDLAEAQTRILALGLGMDETKANINKIIAETANIIEDTDLKHFQSFAKLVRSGEGLNAALVFLDHGMMALASNLPIASTNFAMRKCPVDWLLQLRSLSKALLALIQTPRSNQNFNISITLYINALRLSA